MKRNILVAILAGLVVIGLLASLVGCAGYPVATPKARFKIATTTSLYDTGLWSYLEPLFEEKENVELDIVYAGTGAALNQGKSGNVDAVIVHDPDQEKPFVDEGWGINKRSFAYNFFMIAGPSADPAGIKWSGACGCF